MQNEGRDRLVAIQSGITQEVCWEYTDPSNSTYAQTGYNGGMYYDLQVKLDPLGGNVGLSTPYYTINPEPPPEPQIPTLYPMDDASPMYVNGQRVTATLDGMSISYGQAMSMLQNGSAIPAALASYMSDPRFRFENVGSGIFRAFIPGRNDAPPPSNTPNDGSAYGTLDRWVSFFVPISWGAQQPTQQGQSQQINNPTNCEKYIAEQFGDPRAYFADDEDGDGVDLTKGSDRSGTNIYGGTGHGGAHLYGSATDADVSTDIYIPKSGKLLPVHKSVRYKNNKFVGYGTNSQSTYSLVYFAKLGIYKKVTLAIFHIADVNPVLQSDGRTRIGTLGGFEEGGTWTFKGGKKGKHAHFELYKDRWLSIPGKKPFLKFSSICPK